MAFPASNMAVVDPILVCLSLSLCCMGRHVRVMNLTLEMRLRWTKVMVPLVLFLSSSNDNSGV